MSSSSLSSNIPDQRLTTWRMAGSLFALLAMLISFYLLLYDLGRTSLVCPISGCEVVQASVYSKWFGLPVAGFGFVFYLGLFSLSMFGLYQNHLFGQKLQKLMLFFSSLGLLTYAYFTALEWFVIHAWCFWCVTSSLMLLGFFVTTIQGHRISRNA
jgi:uncharacterized membrane protein